MEKTEKVLITKKQFENYNEMLSTLKKISKEFMSAEELQKKSQKMYGLDYDEALEMAYENIQSLASRICKQIRPLKLIEISNPRLN